MRKVFVGILHILINVIIQSLLWTLIIWYYDYNVIDCVVFGGMDLALIFMDYILCKIIICSTSVKTKHAWILHFLDLIIIAPILYIVIYQFLIKGVIEAKVLYPGLTVIIINSILVYERMQLFNCNP